MSDTVNKVEGGWVIEEGNSEVSRPRYWMAIDKTGNFWSLVSTNAVRFARREDALIVRSCIEKMYPDDGTHRVAFHEWG